MSTQLCPKCNQNAFTWHIDDDDNFTTWGCSHCGYKAKEDKSLERRCESCGNKTEIRLEDQDKVYWWCCRCHNTSLITVNNSPR